MNNAIMVFSALGDIAALLPYIRQIKPKPTIITSKLGYELLKDEFENFIILQSKSILNIIKLIVQIRQLKLDTLIDFQCNDRSKFISKFSNANKIVNNDNINTNNQVHIVLREIAQKASIYKEFVFHELFSKKAKTYIVLNTGSSTKWISKRLPIDKWIEINKILYKRFKLPFYLVGDKNEIAYNNNISKHLSGKIIDFTGKTSIQELKQILNNAFLTISTDSAAMHISSVQATPTIGLFGSTSWIKSAPFGPWSTVVYDKVYFADNKPLKENSMKIDNYFDNISINEALNSIEKYLG